MSVLTENTGRGDIALIRGATNQWGVLWEQSVDGADYQPVNLTGWTGALELRSTLGDVWLSVPVLPSVSGLTTITVTPEHLADVAWAGRSGGTWAVNLTAPDGHVERLAAGYFHLEA